MKILYFRRRHILRLCCEVILQAAILFGILAISNTVSWCAPSPQPGSPDFFASPAHPTGWRGDGTGRFPEATPVVSWSEEKKVRWSVKVGRAYSSPVLCSNTVLVTSEPNLLLCLSQATGQERWRLETRPQDIPDEANRKAAEEYVPPKNGSGLAAATPATDGQNIYFVFANGIVRAVDCNGKPKWASVIGAEQSTAYGRSASPILAEGKLIVHMTHLYAFDAATGKLLWSNTEAKSTYGTPASVRMGGTNYIITAAGDMVRVDDGTNVLSGLGQSQYASPVIGKNVVYFCDRVLKAVELSGNLTSKDLWETELPGDVIGTPLWQNGLLFLATGKGDLFVFDISGKEPEKPIIDARLLFGEQEGAVPIAYSSITLAGKFLFLASNKGEMAVMDATREARLQSKNKLPVGTVSLPVFSGKNMFVRDGEKLYCIGE